MKQSVQCTQMLVIILNAILLYSYEDILVFPELWFAAVNNVQSTLSE